MKRSNLTFPFSLDLVFVDDRLTGASAHIVLRCHSKDEGGTTYLTPDCKTPEELHYQIDRLHAELENARNRGIRAFVEKINRSKRKRKRK